MQSESQLEYQKNLLNVEVLKAPQGGRGAIATLSGRLQLDRPVEDTEQEAALYCTRGNGQGPGVLLQLGCNVQ